MTEETDILEPQTEELDSQLSAEEERLRLINLLEAKDRNPLAFFRPTDAQQEWIKMIGNHVDHPNIPRVKFFSGANKVCKTAATVACLGNIIWGPQNKYFEYPIFQKWPYPRTIWISSEDSTLKEIFIPEMEKWFPRDRAGNLLAKIDKSGKTFTYHWTCQGRDGEFNIYIKTYDTDAKKHESALLGLWIFSEPMPRDIFYCYPARMPSGGMVWMEFTPLMESAWVHDELMSDIEITEQPCKFVEKGRSTKMEVLYADVESACKQHGGHGMWEHHIIDRWNEECDPEEKLARLHGKFAELKGRVFREGRDYSSHTHFIEPFKLPPSAQIIMIIDPHERRYPMVHWEACLPEGDYRFILAKEWPFYEPNAGFETLTDCPYTIKEICAKLLEYEDMWGFRVVRRIMDPYRGKQPYQDSGLNVKQTYARYGIVCGLPQKMHIEVGHDAIIEYWRCKELKKPEHPLYQDLPEKPKAVIFDDCLNTIRAIKNYKFKRREKNAERLGKSTVTIDVEEKFKDPIDLMRYLFTANPKYDWGARTSKAGWRARAQKRRETTNAGWKER